MLTKKVLTNVCLKSLFLFDGIEYGEFTELYYMYTPDAGMSQWLSV